MPREADFSHDVIERLAKSAGYVCSWPGCDAPTVGPSTERAGAISNIGMACHIAAASGGPGARRVAPGMSGVERASYSNGIWMCFTHGKLIDTDETRFSIAMLHRWRDLAELRARIRLESSGRADIKPSALLEFQLVSNSIDLPGRGGENALIGDALHDSLVEYVWGKDIADSVRDLAIEIARNAFQHGSASSFALNVTAKAIRIVDDGRAFDTMGLTLDSGRGGARALHELRLLAGERIIMNWGCDGSVNVTTLALVRRTSDALELTPCSLAIDHDVLDSATRIERLDSCDSVYVVVPPYTTLSDVYKLRSALPILAPDATYIFVVSRTSQVVQRLISELFPGAKIVSVDAP